MITISLTEPINNKLAFPFVNPRPWAVMVGSRLHTFEKKADALTFFYSMQELANIALYELMSLEGEVYQNYMRAQLYGLKAEFEFERLTRTRKRMQGREGNKGVYNVNDLLNISDALRNYTARMRAFWTERKDTVQVHINNSVEWRIKQAVKPLVKETQKEKAPG